MAASTSTSSGSKKEVALKLRTAAETAIESIGLGYDVVVDLRLKYCKKKTGSSSPSSSASRLIAIDEDQVRDIAIPGGVLVQNVSKSIKCDKGERMRFSSDVLSFQQMCEQFNQELSLSGKIPTGHFNSAFEFSNAWQKDAANTKTLAFDGVTITLYSIALEKSHVALRHHVKQDVPSSWDPAALARFIEKYGTHVVVGVKMGGKDVVYMKQLHSSELQSTDVQKKFKDVADNYFTDPNEHSNEKAYNGLDQGPFMDTSSLSIHSKKEEMTFIFKRRGGSGIRSMSHNKWCQTVQLDPDVISMSFIPISSLLSGVDGSGFLSHAINLYLRYKPPIEELHQFLEFQLPRQWAPVFGDLPLGPDKKKQSGASLQFSLMGPKLYVNTNKVEVGTGPVTGLRLYLEGKRSNCLAIHLQHLSSLPRSFNLHSETNGNQTNSQDRRYIEKVQWKSFSHVCTAPVESEDDMAIVSGAQFEVRESGMKNVLFLSLNFSKVVGASVVKGAQWEGSPGLGQKSGILSSFVSSAFSTTQRPLPRPSDVNMNSALYPDGPPMPAQKPKFLRFVDTTEMTRGPQDSPGYWVVSGARLVVDKGKISLSVKYSLLAVISPDEEVF